MTNSELNKAVAKAIEDGIKQYHEKVVSKELQSLKAEIEQMKSKIAELDRRPATFS